MSSTEAAATRVSRRLCVGRLYLWYPKVTRFTFDNHWAQKIHKHNREVSKPWMVNPWYHTSTLCGQFTMPRSVLFSSLTKCTPMVYQLLGSRRKRQLRSWQYKTDRYWTQMYGKWDMQLSNRPKMTSGECGLHQWHLQTINAWNIRNDPLMLFCSL